MTAEADLVWTWIQKCAGDLACWCPDGAVTGPQYATKVKLAVWDELTLAHDGETAFCNTQKIYKFMDGQNKGDGRGPQGNVWLKLPNKKKIYMNLHIPLFKVEVIVEAATDGGGDWSTVQNNRFKGKK